MEAEQKNGSDTLAYGNNSSAKRGRGRPKGSLNKKYTHVKDVTHHARASKKVDFFSPETVIRPKIKKRGRPKKIRIPGRPRKIPLTPEEEAERILRLSKKRKRRLSKPLGRPRIHPLLDKPKEKRGRGRPRKYEPMVRAQSGALNGNFGTMEKSLKSVHDVGEGTPRKRGRPRGSFKKKRGRPAGTSTMKRVFEGTSGKRGRPPGSGTKLKVQSETNGTPRKRGRPPGSGTKVKIIMQEPDGTPRKRGRPPGSGNKVKVAKQETDGIPRKRGRPPGSGTKVKVAPQEANGVPRKRGRPPSMAKTDVKESGDLRSNSASDQPRKRGRPSKSSLTEALPTSKADEGQRVMNEEPSPKRPCNPFASEISSCGRERVADAKDLKASEKESGLEPTKMGAAVLPLGGAVAGRDTKPNSVQRDGESKKQVEGGSVEVLLTDHGSNIKKNASSRVAGRSQKNK